MPQMLEDDEVLKRKRTISNCLKREILNFRMKISWIRFIFLIKAIIKRETRGREEKRYIKAYLSQR